MTTFYCLRFETPPNWRTRSLYLYSPGTGWSSIIADTGLPFHRLLCLTGLRWRYSTPPPHGILNNINWLVGVMQTQCSLWGTNLRVYYLAQMKIAPQRMSKVGEGQKQNTPLLRASHRKANSYPRRRVHPISRRLSCHGTRKNNVMGPDGGQTQKWLCWQIHQQITTLIAYLCACSCEMRASGGAHERPRVPDESRPGTRHCSHLHMRRGLRAVRVSRCQHSRAQVHICLAIFIG
jgi:hypothetical protein